MTRRPILSIVLLALLFATAACHNPYKDGLEALSEGNYERAESDAREGLKEDPQSPEYNLLLADAYIGRGEYKKAEPHAQKAFDSGKLPAAAGRSLGKVRWELGEPIKAVEAWRAARKAEPDAVSDDDFGRALETALSMATSTAEFEDALSLRGELKQLNPNHPEVTDEAFRRTRENLAQEYRRNMELAKAVKLYEELSKEFGSAEYDSRRARIYAELNENEKSKAAFEQYIEKGKGEEKLERTIDSAARAERLGAMPVSLHFYEKSISLMPKANRERARVHLKIAELLLKAQAVDQAKTHLDDYIEDMKVVSGEPVSAHVYRKVSEIAGQNRAPQLSIAYLEEAIVNARVDWGVSRQLADLYARRARTADVERVLKQYVDRATDRKSAQINVARWANNRLNYDLAIFFFEAAVQDGKVASLVWLDLARAYAQVGRMDDVNRALKNYTKQLDDKERAALDVASIYRGQRMYEEAEKALLSAAKADPDDLHITRQLETLYREWGRPKKIHDGYGRWLKAKGNRAIDYQHVGERFYRQNEWDEALPYLTKAAKLGETSAWLQVADIYKRQRKERDMKKALDEYLAASTNEVSALSLVWQRYRTSAWSHEAIPILERLISLEPTNVTHYEQLSELYFEQGRDVEAFELWKRYISLSRNPIRALEAMTRRFERHNYHDWMLSFLHQIREKHDNPDPEIYRLLGDAHYAAMTRRSRNLTEPNPNAIFSEQNKAKSYYEKYLEEAKPTTRELQKFASVMKNKRMWEVAAKAYKRSDLSAPLSTHHILDYGAVLLKLGKAEEAKAVFNDYYERRGESMDAARAISKELAIAEQYDALEPYLKKMMESGDDTLLRTAFLELSEVYRQTDRGERIADLATQYLSKTQNPTEARRNVLQVLGSAGRWDDAVEQLERIAEIQGDEFKFELGRSLYMSGDPDRAEGVFRDYASKSVTSQEAWLQVAMFYEEHAQPERAEEAYNSAVSAAQISDHALAERGRFRIRRGMVPEGQADFADARSKVEPAARWNIWKLEIETLKSVGRHTEAAKAARAALVNVFVERDFFYRAIADVELSGVDTKVAERMLGELKNAGLPVDQLVPILLEHGYREDAAAVIESEINNGDYVVGGQLAVTHADVFTELGGMERLLRTLQPLLERGSRDGRLQGQIGEYLLREGRLSEGALYVRAAIDRGEAHLRPMLAAAYVKMGHDSEALDLYQVHLDNVVAAGRGIALRQMAAQFDVSGKSDLMEAFLRHQISDDELGAVAAPLLAKRLVATGKVGEAMSLVRGMWSNLSVDTEQTVTNLEERLELADSILVGVAQVIAGEGYLQEAMILIEEAPPRIADTERVRDLKLRLAAASKDVDTEKELELALMNLGESNSEALQKLKIARLMMLGGDSPRAIKLAEPMLQNGDFEVAREALRVMTSAGVAMGDTSQFDGWIKTFIDSRPDKVGARSAAADAMRILAVDDKAIALTKQNLKLVPTESNVRSALGTAYTSSDKELVEQSAELFWRVTRNPAGDVQNMAGNFIDRQDPKLIGALFEPYRKAFPEVWAARSAQIRLHYRIGEPELARDEILTYLENTNYDSASVESVLDLLDDYKLYGDIARFVGTRVETDKLTRRSAEILGRANLMLGFNEDGLALLDKYVEASPDPAHEASEVAMALVIAGKPKLALRFADMAVAKRPGRSIAQLHRAIARIAMGDASADAEVQKYLGDGLGRRYRLGILGKVALEAGLDDLADKYMKELAMSSTSETPETYIRTTIAWYREAERPKEAVAFVEKHWPLISAGAGVAGENLLPTLAGLYEEAGMHERSFQLYEEGILRELVARPFEDSLHTYRNNLAYTYSTTDQNVDKGMDLIRLAMAGDRRRNESFIDTLGWLEYRRGNLEVAEREVRRALTSSLGTTSSLVELYSHLAELREARGFHRDSIWMKIYVESIK